jgi:hypothetical protein
MEATQQNASWNEQRFQVRGFISFSVMNKAHLDGEQLRELVKQADQQHPWISYWEGGERAPSINWMSQAEMQEASAWTDRSYKIEIRPPYHLKAAQVYAYNRYLCCLAEALAAMGTEGVHTVQSWFVMDGGGGSYMTPAAEQRLGGFLFPAT